MLTAAERNTIFQSAIESIASSLQRHTSDMGNRGTRVRRPGLVAPDGVTPLSAAVSPVRHSYRQISRKSAQLKGSLRKWQPSFLTSEQQISVERERIVQRAADLTNSDPHAAGATENLSTLFVGAGLNPHPLFTGEEFGIDKDQARQIAKSAKAVFSLWSPYADAGQRMNFAQLQFLAMRSVIQYGEFLFVLPMIADPLKPYSLALQAINPLRLKTPSDKLHNENIRDGVELGKYGEPVAYWIKRGGKNTGLLSDTSDNFVRIPRARGHRVNVLHGFFTHDAEQVRGYPLFSPGLKFFRDLSDYLDAELVSNVVTAAFSVFIEQSSADPLYAAQNLATVTDTAYKSDGTTYDERYQELVPGLIMYGGQGEKPHVISAQRPGATFEPFVRTIEKSLAMSIGLPHSVMFRDFEGLNFASYRSALLEAWRVVSTKRSWLGHALCSPVYKMLLEEAYLRGDFAVSDFYENMNRYCAVRWIGPPKGQIEPGKEIQAEILAIQNNLKSREEVLLEQGRDLEATFNQLADEQGMMENLDLTEEKITSELPEVEEPQNNATD